MLEQPLPHLCADRIDYNIQGAYYRNFLTKEETQELFRDLHFVEGKWLITRKDLAAKLMRFSLFMTEECWGSAVNYATSCWLAEAILQGLKVGLISWNEFHFGTDQVIWDKLQASQDPLIQNRMDKLVHPQDYYRFVDPERANVLVKFRCRGIDPWIVQEGKIMRLSESHPELARAFQTLQKKAAAGWAIEMW